MENLTGFLFSLCQTLGVVSIHILCVERYIRCGYQNQDLLLYKSGSFDNSESEASWVAWETGSALAEQSVPHRSSHKPHQKLSVVCSLLQIVVYNTTYRKDLKFTKAVPPGSSHTEKT